MGHACGKIRTAQSVFTDTVIDISRIEKGELYVSGQFLSPDEVPSIIESSQSLLRINSNYTAHMNLGICLFYLGYVDAAEFHLTKSRTISKSFESSYILGLIYLNKNDLKQAQMSFQNSISEAPSVFVYIKLSEVLLRRNKHEHARKYAKQGLGQYPKNPELLSIVGMSYMSSNPVKASKYCKRAIKVDPGLFKPYVNIADIQKALEKFEEAEEMYKIAIDKGNPAQKGFAQMMLSLLYFEVGNLPKAISCCKKSIESNPNLEEIMLNKGFGMVFKNRDFEKVLKLIQEEKYEKSSKILKNLYKKDKKNVVVCFFLANCYLNLDIKSKSKHFFKKVVKLAEFRSNNEVNNLFVNRSENILATQFGESVEFSEQEFEKSKDNDIDELKSEKSDEKVEIEVEGDEDGERALMTEEGNYPNFQDIVKEKEAIDEEVAEIKVESLPAKMIPRNIKSNVLRQFAKSADPEPDKNCQVF